MLSHKQCVKSYGGYIFHLLPVRICFISSSITRYANKSHICGLPSSRSCFMRRAASPGLYLPSRIALNSARDSPVGRERCTQANRGLPSLVLRPAEPESLPLDPGSV